MARIRSICPALSSIGKWQRLATGGVGRDGSEGAPPGTGGGDGVGDRGRSSGEEGDEKTRWPVRESGRRREGALI